MNKSIKKIQPTVMLSIIAFVVISFKSQNDTLRTNEITTFTNIADSKNSFTLKSVTNIAIPIESIDKIHKFDSNEKFGGFRCVTTGILGATDYGPYKELYFIFDNAFEMPHRTAIFKIGNLANITSFKKVSESEYQITGDMFSNEKYESNQNVLVKIDASKVLEKERKFIHDKKDIEGDFEAEIIVSVFNLK